MLGAGIFVAAKAFACGPFHVRGLRVEIEERFLHCAAQCSFAERTRKKKPRRSGRNDRWLLALVEQE